jgi:hypothetical protein
VKEPDEYIELKEYSDDMGLYETVVNIEAETKPWQELKLHISVDTKDGKIWVRFNQPVEEITLDQDNALKFARLLVWRSMELEGKRRGLLPGRKKTKKTRRKGRKP